MWTFGRLRVLVAPMFGGTSAKILALYLKVEH